MQRPDCTLEPESLTGALASQAGVVHLGAGPHTGDFASAAAIEIAGSGGTVIKPLDPGHPTLALTAPDVVVHNARVEGRTAIAVADLFQRIDVAAAAASIDRGLGRAALTGLLGGYGADADAVAVRAVFKDPEARALGRLDLAPVTPADRANTTTLLFRAAAGAIPPRTRAIDVLVHAERRAGTYTDAHADNLGPELSVPGVPADPPADPGDPPVDDLEPFHGVVVVTARARLDAAGRARFTLACATSTVGACRGTLELRAGRERLGPIVGFAVRPGLAREVDMRLWRPRRARAADRHRLRRAGAAPAGHRARADQTVSAPSATRPG